MGIGNCNSLLTISSRCIILVDVCVFILCLKNIFFNLNYLLIFFYCFDMVILKLIFFKKNILIYF